MERQRDNDLPTLTRHAPALVPAIAALIGVAGSLQAPFFDLRLCLLLAVLSLALAVGCGRRWGWWCLALAAGATSGGLEQARLWQGGLPAKERPLELVGHVRSDWNSMAGIDGEDGWWVELRQVRWSQLRPCDDRERERGTDAIRQCRHHGNLPGRLILSLPGAETPPAAGAVRARGLVRQARAPRNGLPAPALSWRLTLASRRLLEVETEPPLWLRWSSRWRQAVDEAWRKAAPEQASDSPGLALTRALVLGDRSQLAPEWQRTLRRLGLAHVLAVSGLHVGLLAGLVWLAGMSLPRRLRLLLPLVAVLAYALLIGPRPSMLRAAVMGLLAGASLYLRRPPAALQALAVFVLGMVLVEPGIVLDLGFQLSASATAGIVLLGPWLAARWQWMPSAWRLPLATSVGAQLASLPFALPAFHLLPLAAVLLNLLIVPWIALMLTLGIIWTGMALCWLGSSESWLGERVAAGFVGLLDLGTLPLRVLTALPPDGWTTVPLVMSWAGALLLALLLLAVLWLPGRARRLVLVGGLGLVALHVCWSACFGASSPAPSWAMPGVNGVSSPSLTVLDVGQGDALLVRSGRRALLIDGGGWRQGDLAGRVLVPALAARGVRRLDGILITHPDLDHCGGAAQLADYVPVSEVWLASGVSRAPCVQDLVQRRGLPVRVARAGQSLHLGSWRLQVLHPEAKSNDLERASRRQETSNDQSIVLRADGAGRCFLLTGDLEAAGEQQLRRRWRTSSEKRCDVLKVPHHGSRTSTTPGLLHDVRPRWALLSVGANNRYGHPHPSVVRRLDGYGVKVLRTDWHGAVTLRLMDEGRLSVRTEHTPGNHEE